MFTGIIQALGHLVAKTSKGQDVSLEIHTGKLQIQSLKIGDSIAVNGVCLTVVEWVSGGFVADASLETLDCTTLGGLKTATVVNLEAALCLGQPMGGHWVSGHVDGLGHIVSRKSVARSTQFEIQAPEALAPFIAAKGSVTLDGVSLTVNKVDGCVFSVNLIPHTLECTNAETWQSCSKVNLEVDIIARYLDRLLKAPSSGSEYSVEAAAGGSKVDMDLLARTGFSR